MAGEVMVGLSIFNTMMNQVKALKDIDNAVNRNAAVIELQDQIFSAQSAQTALIARVSELEKEVARFEAWEGEKQRYELHERKTGRFTRKLKTGMEHGEPSHEICAQCYVRGVKSILQSRTSEVGRYHLLTCSECRTDLNLSLAL